jgi:hypothetical protein
MEKKSVYRTIDGRVYDVTMSWEENFKDSDHVFPIKFQFVDRATNKPMKLPREIATFTVGDPEEAMGDRVKHYFGGDRASLMTDYLEMAYRRVCDWVERGK